MQKVSPIHLYQLKELFRCSYKRIHEKTIALPARLFDLNYFFIEYAKTTIKQGAAQ